MGLPFEIIPPAINEEVLGQESPANHVRRLALEKAESVASHYPDSLVIGSDTVIELDGQILGKPADLEEAHHMLTRLRGRCHLVHTGLALVAKAKQIEEAMGRNRQSLDQELLTCRLAGLPENSR